MQVNLHHTRLAHVELHAQGGASIGDCIQEAIAVSSAQTTDVVLIHNNKKYVVKQHKLFQAVEWPDA